MQRAVLLPVLVSSLVSAAVALAVAVLVFPPHSQAAQDAQTAQPPYPVLRAERFEVVDGQGALRMRFGVEQSGAANVVVYDPSGRMRLAVGLADDGQPVMGFWDPAGQPRLGAGFDPAGGPSFVIRGDQGQVLWQAPPQQAAPAQPAR
jgi:hypothetical protein